MKTTTSKLILSLTLWSFCGVIWASDSATTVNPITTLRSDGLQNRVNTYRHPDLQLKLAELRALETAQDDKNADKLMHTIIKQCNKIDQQRTQYARRAVRSAIGMRQHDLYGKPHCCVLQ